MAFSLGHLTSADMLRTRLLIETTENVVVDILKKKLGFFMKALLESVVVCNHITTSP